MEEKSSWRNIPILNHFNCFALPSTTKNAVESVDDEDNESYKRKTKGGNESCEKIAVVGLQSNMSIYLKTKYNMKLVTIVNMLNIWSGTTSFATLGGAFLADSYIGRYLTIVIASLSYFLGMGLWTLTALVPALRPPHCSDEQAKSKECKSPSKEQMFFLVVAFVFMSIGSAGIRPCAMAFGADQFQEKGKEAAQQKKSLHSFFNWYYLANAATVLVAGIAILYLQTNVSWGLGFGVPTLLMLISLIAFVLGTPIFHREVPQGSPFTGIAQIVVAFIKKRNLPLPSDPTLLYSDPRGPKTHPTPKFRFLNKAAIAREGDCKQADGSIARPWRLCSIQRIEELKVILTILPIYSCLIIDSITSGQQGITPLQRMGIGYIISSLSLLVAGLVELKRRNVAKGHGLMDDPSAIVPISVFWLVPQFVIQGLGICFHVVGYMNLFYNEFPTNLRSTAMALASCMYASGDYLSAVFVSVIHRTTGVHGKPDWLDDNVNLGRLDYLYWLLSAMGAVNVVYFLFCSSRYTYRENPVADADQTSGMSDGREMESKQIHV
ncbi:protein NRT1/ PTR FAMILY 2.13-like [Cryptomeria japonica]|uniref:protein NRT1/ PTR FAMILY 2.13-like n=1 Tax=Cryptomeria japonica TaxID=3369 RepID=UPI0027DA49A0|nr:protein NRT1/ PTR FAMILY 2.13-like [Cryptomeria japonica]